MWVVYLPVCDYILERVVDVSLCVSVGGVRGVYAPSCVCALWVCVQSLHGMPCMVWSFRPQLQVRPTWVSLLALLLDSFVTLSKLLDLPVLLFPHL